MSNDFDNTNRGSIWKNDSMREDKQDPQFTGTLNVEGVEYYVNAWLRKAGAKTGAPSMTFSINRKDANRQPNPNPPARASSYPQDEPDDDIPY